MLLSRGRGRIPLQGRAKPLRLVFSQSQGLPKIISVDQDLSYHSPYYLSTHPSIQPSFHLSSRYDHWTSRLFQTGVRPSFTSCGHRYITAQDLHQYAQGPVGHRKRRQYKAAPVLRARQCSIAHLQIDGLFSNRWAISMRIL